MRKKEEEENTWTWIIVISIFSIGLLFSSEYGQGLFLVLKSNTILWSLFFSGIIFALYSKYRFSKKITALETFVQMIVGTLILIASYFFFYTFTTDIKDNVILNDLAKTIVYEEPWTERYTTVKCTGSGSSKSCKTVRETRYHSAQYYITTENIGNININSSDWNNFVKEFNNKKETKQFRSGQTLTSKVLGEGDIWTSIPNRQFPVSTDISTVNYIKASKYSLMRKSKVVNNKDIQNITYPKIKNVGFGYTKFNRVHLIGKVDNINKNILSQMDKQLNLISSIYGPKNK